MHFQFTVFLASEIASKFFKGLMLNSRVRYVSF